MSGDNRRRHPVAKIQEALAMIKRGDNPFRAAKKAGIPRGTLLYHLERVQDGEFETGVNPIIMHIHRQIELLLWKTRLRVIKNLFIKSRTSDEKMSALIWKNLNDSTVPPVGSRTFPKPVVDGATIEDKVTFREFVVERKGKSPSEETVVDGDLSEAGLDGANAAGAGAVVEEDGGALADEKKQITASST